MLTDHRAVQDDVAVVQDPEQKEMHYHVSMNERSMFVGYTRNVSTRCFPATRTPHFTGRPQSAIRQAPSCELRAVVFAVHTTLLHVEVCNGGAVMSLE
ncbi:hypothetical protein BaRGS_00035097 [Batillaria attramentaria]|uniref:Uncharacterized protein n=1 Tax=Batillaria attramentaria TaxID=370345 RepID=A0ABD0JFP4_9CAEN